MTSIVNGIHPLKSPASLKTQRTPSFSRDGLIGSAHKARNMSQSSDHRPDALTNGVHKPSSDEGSNPLKRRNTDAGVDYPRRRATIAVRFFGPLDDNPAPADLAQGSSLTTAIVRSVSLSQVSLRWNQAQV